MVNNRPERRKREGTQAALAARLGISTAAVAKGVASGRVDGAKKPDGSLDIDLAEKLWRENTHPADRRNKRTKVTKSTDAETLREEAEAIGVDPDDLLPYNEAARLLKNYQARLAELDYEQKAGKLLDVDQVEKSAFKVARLTRDAMLAIPDRLSAELAGVSDPFVIHEKLIAEIHAAIAEITKPLNA